MYYLPSAPMQCTRLGKVQSPLLCLLLPSPPLPCTCTSKPYPTPRRTSTLTLTLTLTLHQETFSYFKGGHYVHRATAPQ